MRRLVVLLVALVSSLLFAPPAFAATPLGGGSHLYNPAFPGGGCTAGFAAKQGTSWYLIAEPSCGSVGTTLYSGGVLVGPIVAAPTPGGATLVHVTNQTSWQLVGWVGGGVVFAGSTQAPVGSPVCLIGVGAGTHCGVITARNVTVNFPTGLVTGVTRTNVCHDPGSPAVTYVSGAQAQGVLIGGSGNCASGGTTYFAPLPPIFAAYNLQLQP